MILWPIAWLLTSVMLGLAGVQYGPGWFLPVVYVGLNAAAVAGDALALGQPAAVPAGQSVFIRREDGQE